MAPKSDKDFPVVSLGSNLAYINNEGANVGVFHGEDGTFVIDASFASQSQGIASAIASISNTPIRGLINTHWHQDHVQGNSYFAEQGVPVYAHDNTLARMASDQFLTPLNMAIPPSPTASHPTRTFSDRLTIRANKDVMHIMHIPNAHTDGDAIVYWEKANVILASDFYVPEEDLPFVDYDSKGNFEGFIQAVGSIIELCNDDTRIIPGHAPNTASKQDLIIFQKKLIQLRDIVNDKIAQGFAPDDIDAVSLFKDFYQGGLFTPEHFLRMIYLSLTAD